MIGMAIADSLGHNFEFEVVQDDVITESSPHLEYPSVGFPGGCVRNSPFPGGKVGQFMLEQVRIYVCLFNSYCKTSSCICIYAYIRFYRIILFVPRVNGPMTHLWAYVLLIVCSHRTAITVPILGFGFGTGGTMGSIMRFGKML